MYFRKVLVINFISSYSSLLKHFSFAELLQIEYNEQVALQKTLVIATFVVQFEQLLWEGLPFNSIITYNSLLFFSSFFFSHPCIFTHPSLIEDYKQGALGKELIIAPLIDRFQKATLGKVCWQILLALGATCFRKFVFVYLRKPVAVKKWFKTEYI